jgi:hypothetical protein
VILGKGVKLDKKEWEKKLAKYFEGYVKYDVPPSTMSHEWVKRYRGWDEAGIAQLPEQIELMLETIEKFEIDIFFELGTMGGGLSLMMFDRMEVFTDFVYYGFEIDPQFPCERVLNSPFFTLGDVFSQPIKSYVVDKIHTSEKHALVFCDDGNKPKEMIEYSMLLRVGDYIMGHDYPGEITDKTLDALDKQIQFIEEIDRQKYRDIGYSLWRRYR